MKHPINYRYLTDSPYGEEETAKAFVFDQNAEHLKEALVGLSNSLKEGYPSAFLVSGYRGVGKTSAVMRAVDLVTLSFEEGGEAEANPQIKVAHLQVTDYKDHRSLLWSMIRQLYLSLEKEILSPKASEPLQRLEYYYRRTFEEISDVQTAIELEESADKETFTFDYKKLLAPIGVAVAGGANLLGHFLPEDKWSNILSTTLLAGGAIWGATAFQLEKSRSQSETVSRKLESKKLFDEDIAEYRLLELLQDLQKYYQIVFVIDELDKITEEDKLMNLFGSLKSFLLSNRARFVIIDSLDIYLKTGWRFSDNNLLDSVFSRKLHIGLPNLGFFTAIMSRFFSPKITQSWLYSYLNSKANQKGFSKADHLLLIIFSMESMDFQVSAYVGDPWRLIPVMYNPKAVYEMEESQFKQVLLLEKLKKLDYLLTQGVSEDIVVEYCDFFGIPSHREELSEWLSIWMEDTSSTQMITLHKEALKARKYIEYLNGRSNKLVSYNILLHALAYSSHKFRIDLPMNSRKSVERQVQSFEEKAQQGMQQQVKGPKLPQSKL